MTNIIDETIELLAARPFAFSVRDVVSLAKLDGLENSVEAAVKEQCLGGSILRLDEHHGWGGAPPNNLDWIDPNTGEVHCASDLNCAKFMSLFLGRRIAEKWWVDRTVSWARAGVDCVSHSQLAGSMSLAFDNRRWFVPPQAILAVGRSWAMVSEGCVPETFVFPWATLLRANPQFLKPFRSLFSVDSDALLLEADSTTIDQALSRLPEREATIVRSRFGLDSSCPKKLSELGKLFGITRERVRQLEKRALRRKEFKFPVWLSFAANFVQSGGSLLIQDQEAQQRCKLLGKVWDLNATHVTQLNISVIAAEFDLADYRRALSSEEAIADAKKDQGQTLAESVPRFLSHSDSTQIRGAEDEFRASQVSTTKPRMIRQALRSLGRAAHYTEIAEVCNRLFPDKEHTVQSWHAALSLCAQPEHEVFGIVWIGRKGTYGLREHGYSRPDTGLYEEVAQIVSTVFERTKRPASLEVVIAEMSKKRRELSRTSVMMALSFNDRLSAVSGGRYVPKTGVQTDPREAPQVQYDISAAFQAFSAEEDS